MSSALKWRHLGYRDRCGYSRAQGSRPTRSTTAAGTECRSPCRRGICTAPTSWGSPPSRGHPLLPPSTRTLSATHGAIRTDRRRTARGSRTLKSPSDCQCDQCCAEQLAQEILPDELQIPERRAEPAGQSRRPHEQRQYFVARRVERHVLHPPIECHAVSGWMTDGASAQISSPCSAGNFIDRTETKFLGVTSARPRRSTSGYSFRNRFKPASAV